MLSLAHRTMIDLSPADLVHTAAAAGFDAVGFPLIPVRDDEPAWRMLEEEAVLKAVLAALAQDRLSVLDIELVRIEATTRAADFRRMFEAGGRLGARFVCAIAGDDDESRIAANLADLCAEAAPFGLRIALEFMERFGVRSLAAAQRIVTTAAHPGASILVDARHFYRTGTTLADLARIDPQLLHYMQINDAQTGVWTKVLPGDGDLALTDLLHTLPAGIPISIEVSGPAAEKSDPKAYAQRACATSRVVMAS